MTQTLTQTEDRRPVYVRRLDLEQRQDAAELAALHEHLLLLKAYLTSPKFGMLRAVNTADVLLRMDEAVSAGLDARAEVV